MRFPYLIMNQYLIKKKINLKYQEIGDITCYFIEIDLIHSGTKKNKYLYYVK